MPMDTPDNQVHTEPSVIRSERGEGMSSSLPAGPAGFRLSPTRPTLPRVPSHEDSVTPITAHDPWRVRGSTEPTTRMPGTPAEEG
jgi:hypothetical protein